MSLLDQDLHKERKKGEENFNYLSSIETRVLYTDLKHVSLRDRREVGNMWERARRATETHVSPLRNLFFLAPITFKRQQPVHSCAHITFKCMLHRLKACFQGSYLLLIPIKFSVVWLIEKWEQDCSQPPTHAFLGERVKTSAWEARLFRVKKQFSPSSIILYD